MCSIFGAIGATKGAKEAFELLAHRGEDGSSFYEDKNIFFGSHRLAIESFSKPHNQPLQKDNLIAIFNGEIYNYKELIKSYNLDAKDEIELILELFILKKDLHKELRGMYAISIFNKVTNELWLFRDLAGKKPLYFAKDDSNFYFASELKALKAVATANIKNLKPHSYTLNKKQLHQFLGFGATISPTTLFKNIYKLPPASSLYFDGKEYFIKTNENILNQKVEIFNILDAKDRYEQMLIEAINIRIPSLKYGVLLSGGLDSSLISALLAKKSKEPINLFSIGYEGYSKYDERAYAKEVAKHLNANFYQFNFTKADFFNTLDEMLRYIDDPIGDPAQIPLFFLIKKAKEQGVKVLFSGDGSDELNLGYRVYKEYLMMEQVKELPYSNWLKNHLRANFSLNKEWEWYKRALNQEVIFRSSSEIYTDRQLNKLLRLQAKDNSNFEAIKHYWQVFKSSNRDIIDWYSYCDLKVNLAEFFLVKVDRVSMANGVEVRTPFLDQKLINLTFKIDSKVRYSPIDVKPIIKEIASKYLPRTIVHRKKKGLNYPFIEWILEENGIEVIYKANEKYNLFKEEHLNFLSQKAKSGKFKQHLFPLYILSRWLLYKNF